MGEGDFMPSGGHSRKRDPKHEQQIKEGGKLADKIHKKAIAYHKAHDIPAAEEQLEKDLENI